MRKSKYLMAGVATAALMFGLNQAVAQSSMSGGADKQQGTMSSQPSTSKGASGAMDHSKSEGSKTIGQAHDQNQSKTVGQARDQKEPKTTGQAREESKGLQPSSKMGDRDKDKMGGNNMKPEQKMGAGTADQTKQNAQRTDQKSKTTTGQSRDEMKTQSPSAGKMGAQPSTNQNSAQTPSSSSSTSKMGQQPQTNQNAQGSSSSNVTTGSASSSATQLTTEQRTEVREKVLANAPRENNVNFAVNVGTVVPHTVHVATVPETLIRIHPEWRGHKYFVVHDEIIIVDSDFRIIAVLPV